MNYANIHCAKGLAILIQLKCKVPDTIYDRHYILKNTTKNVTTRKFYHQRVAVNQVLILIQMTLLYSHRLPQKSSKKPNSCQTKENYLFKYLIRFYFA